MYLSAQTSPEWTSGNAKKWMKSAVWSNGWTVSPHKSVNAVEFACQYHKNKDVWDAAFRFLAEHDLEALSIGNHVILEGKCWATVSEYIPKEVEKGNIESHLRFVDLQYVLWGNEKIKIPLIFSQFTRLRQIFIRINDRRKFVIRIGIIKLKLRKTVFLQHLLQLRFAECLDKIDPRISFNSGKFPAHMVFPAAGKILQSQTVLNRNQDFSARF